MADILWQVSYDVSHSRYSMTDVSTAIAVDSDRFPVGTRSHTRDRSNTHHYVSTQLLPVCVLLRAHDALVERIIERDLFVPERTPISGLALPSA